MAVVKNARGRVLFEGTDEDAVSYVERQFPHVHVEPGTVYQGGPTADVVLVDGDGDAHAYLGGKWTDVDYVVNDGRFENKPVEKKTAGRTTSKGKDE